MNEKIIEGNKLIAKFMKYKFDGIEFIIPEHAIIIPFDCQPKKSTSLHCFTTTIYKPKDLKFHTSWDWLIPVVGKIENMVGCYTPNILIQYHCCTIEDEDKEGIFKFQNSNGCKILAVWFSVVEFIKWYNENKQL